jgi:chromosome segregation ATPase
VSDTEAEIKSLNDDYESATKKVHGMRANVEETRSKQSAIKQGGRVQEALMRQVGPFYTHIYVWLRISF